MLLRLNKSIAIFGVKFVDVIRLCHHLTVKGKCHHGREGDIEQERGKQGKYTE